MPVSATSARHLMIPHFQQDTTLINLPQDDVFLSYAILFQWFESPHENIFRKQQLFIHIDVQFSTTPLTSQGPAGDQYL